MATKKLPDDCMPKCLTCAFFTREKDNDIGECHRFPPTLIPEDDGQCSFSFAYTDSIAWCGEYKRQTN